MSRDSVGDEHDEPAAARWWQTYQLADRDEVDDTDAYRGIGPGYWSYPRG